MISQEQTEKIHEFVDTLIQRYNEDEEFRSKIVNNLKSYVAVLLLTDMVATSSALINPKEIKEK